MVKYLTNFKENSQHVFPEKFADFKNGHKWACLYQQKVCN